MKKLNVNTVVIPVFLFLLGVIFTGYYLFLLPSDLSQALNLPNVDAASDVINNVRIFIGIEFVLGVISILLLFNFYQKKKEENLDMVSNYSNRKYKNENNGGAETEDYADLTENEIKVKNLQKMIDPKTEIKKNLDKLISAMCKEVEASQAAIFVIGSTGKKRILRMVTSYAYYIPESQTVEFELGEGLTGQAAKEGKLVNITAVPDGYIQIFSGLGKATPNNLVLVPFKKENKVLGVLEISSFKNVNSAQEDYLQKAAVLFTEIIQKEMKFEEVEVVNPEN
jgi:putative methionine-R-sulfoxide reductase with GAF domain